MPVRPSKPVRGSVCATSQLPPKAICTSFQSTPASVRASSTASAPISNAVLSPNRPNGWSPTPMIATSFISAPDRRERERHDLVAVAVDVEGDDLELDLHPEVELGRVALGEARLDAYDVVELHEADTEGHERLARRVAHVVDRRRKALRRPRHQRAATRQL